MTEDKKEQTKRNNKPKITLIKNIKYKGVRYKTGQEIEVNAKDKKIFIDAGLAKGD